MPTRIGPTARVPRELQVDPLKAFKWSRDRTFTGRTVLCDRGFATVDEARRAWEHYRRECWARTHLFRLPFPAEVFDGLTLDGLEAVRFSWNHVVFDPVPALEALAADRANLLTFEQTRGARAIGDYLATFRACLDTIEQAIVDLAGYPAGEFRAYPGHLNSSKTYCSTEHR